MTREEFEREMSRKNKKSKEVKKQFNSLVPKKLCPLNQFKPCRGEQCALALKTHDEQGGQGQEECSLRSIGFLDYTLSNSMQALIGSMHALVFELNALREK